MYQLKSLEDTIAAISTPVGQGGIGIIRLSGKEAVPIVEKIFKSKNKKKPSQFQNFGVHYGWIINPSSLDEIIDEVLLTMMRAPQSYTKEDVVELSCHGGVVSLKSILDLVLSCGARLAEPGEFTKRAFLNGRIDLVQAEAVLDIIQSKTNAFLRASTNQLKGELSLELEAIREQLMNVYLELEAVVNFPDDDVDSKNRERIQENLWEAQNRVKKLLDTSDQGRILKEGIKIVLCGKPNVGKSSLLNVLLKEPRAIVSDMAGTTRDTIEEATQIQGIPFHLVDTAGILEPRDLIEEEAIKRSKMSIESADLVLVVLDSSAPLDSEDDKIVQMVKDQNTLIVFNKCDLPERIENERIKTIFPNAMKVRISASQKKGIEDLENLITESVWKNETTSAQSILVSNLRHINALRNAQSSLIRAFEMIKEGLSFEFISEEVKVAVNFLDSITGRNIDDDLLDQIFSQFCIGK